jgi:tape measure domain-containing protein
MSLNVGELFATLRLDTSAFRNALTRAQQDLGRTEGDFQDMGNAAEQAQTAVAGLAMALGGLAVAGAGVVISGVKMNASAEQTQIAFKGLIGNAERANALLSELKDLGTKSPFEFDGLANASLSLINAGVNAKDLTGIMVKLGDTVSVAGGNIQEKLERTTFVIGQMVSNAKIGTDDMNQLADIGIPAWDTLANMLGKSVAETRKLVSEGKLATDTVYDLVDALGSRTEGSMEMQSKTLSGQFSTFKDNLKNVLKEATATTSSLIKNILAEFNLLATGIGSTSPALVKLDEVISNLVADLFIFGERIAKALMQMDTSVVDSFVDSLANFKNAIGQSFNADAFVTFSEALTNLATLLTNIGVGFITVFGSAIAVLSEFFYFLGQFKVLGYIIGAIIGLKVVLAGIGALFAFLTVSIGNSIMALVAFGATMKANVVASGASGFFATLGAAIGGAGVRVKILTALTDENTASLIANRVANKNKLSVMEAERKQRLAQAAAIRAESAAELAQAKQRLANANLRMVNPQVIDADGTTRMRTPAEMADAEKLRQDNIKEAQSNLANAQAKNTENLARARKLGLQDAEALKTQRQVVLNSEEALSANRLTSALSKVGAVATIVTLAIATIVGFFALFDYAITGNTNATKVFLRGLMDIARILGSVVVIAVQMVIYVFLQLVYTLGMVVLGLIRLFDWFGKSEAYESVKGYVDKVESSIDHMGNRIKETSAETWQTAKTFGQKRVEDEKKTETEILLEKAKAEEEARRLEEAKQKKILETIRLTKAGVKTALEDLKNYARDGSIVAIEAMMDIDNEFVRNLNENNLKVMRAMVARLELLKMSMAPMALPPQKPLLMSPYGPSTQEEITKMNEYYKALEIYNNRFNAEGKKMYDAEVASLNARIVKMQELTEETGKLLTAKDEETKVITGGGGNEKTAAEKAFDALKEFVNRKKALNQMSNLEEAKIYQEFRSKYQKNTADQIKIRNEATQLIYDAHSRYLDTMNKAGIERIQKEKELNTLTSKEANGRIITFKTASEREVYEMGKHYNKVVAERNRLIAVEKKYASVSKDAINEAKNQLIEARKNLIDETLQKEKEEVLEKVNERNQAELDAVEKFYDDKIELIDKKLNELRSKYDEQDRANEEFDLIEERAFLAGSVSKEAIDRVKDIDKRLEEIRRERELSKAELESEKEKEALAKQKDSAVKAQEKINEDRLKQTEKDWAITEGKFKAQADDLGTSITSIVNQINGQSNSVKSAGTNFVQALINGINSQKNALKATVDDLANMLKGTNLGVFKAGKDDLYNKIDWNKMSSAQSNLTATNQVIFNAPLMTIQNMNMNDKLDAQILSSQLFDATQRAVRSSGGSLIFARG